MIIFKSITQIVVLLMLYNIGLAYWPVMIIVLFATAWVERYYTTIVVGMLLDVAYGPPPAHHPLHALLFVYTLTAFIIVCFVYLGKKYTSAGEHSIRVGRH